MTAVLAGFLIIGVALPVLPLHVTNDLGFGPLVVGLVAGAQFAAALLSRIWAGSYSDRRGAKRSVFVGLLAAAAAGLLYLLSLAFLKEPMGSVAILLVGRAVLGGAESFIITGGIAWGMGLVERQHAGKVIAWVGTAMFAAMALGGPLGSILYTSFGFVAIALMTAFLPLFVFAYVSRTPAAVLPGHGQHASLNAILQSCLVARSRRGARQHGVLRDLGVQFTFLRGHALAAGMDGLHRIRCCIDRGAHHRWASSRPVRRRTSCLHIRHRAGSGPFNHVASKDNVARVPRRRPFRRRLFTRLPRARRRSSSHDCTQQSRHGDGSLYGLSRCGDGSGQPLPWMGRRTRRPAFSVPSQRRDSWLRRCRGHFSPTSTARKCMIDRRLSLSNSSSDGYP